MFEGCEKGFDAAVKTSVDFFFFSDKNVSSHTSTLQ